MYERKSSLKDLESVVYFSTDRSIIQVSSSKGKEIIERMTKVVSIEITDVYNVYK